MNIFLWNDYYSFWDKPYQEINFKSHANTALLCKLGKMLSGLHMPNEIEIYQS